MALLTFLQQQAIKPITANSEGLFEQFETETENAELAGLLGRAFLYAVQQAPEAYAALLDGAEYEDCTGNTTRHRGLRFVLAYLVFARYSLQAGIKDTYTGLVQKHRTEAESLDYATRKAFVNDTKNIALAEFEAVRDYLNANSTAYPLWVPAATRTHKPHSLNLRTITRRGRGTR